MHTTQEATIASEQDLNGSPLRELMTLVESGDKQNEKGYHDRINKVLSIVTAVVPNALKPFVYSTLKRSDTIRHAYIDGLGKPEYAAEQNRLGWMYALQLKDAITQYEQGAGIKTIETALVNILHIIAKVHKPEVLQSLVYQVVSAFKETSFLDEMKPKALHFLCKYSLRSHSTLEQNVRIISSCLNAGASGIESVIENFEPSQSEQLAKAVCDDQTIQPFSQPEAVASLLKLIANPERARVLIDLIKFHRFAIPRESVQSAHLIKQFLEVVPTQERSYVIANIFQTTYASPFSDSSGFNQLEQITALTNSVEEQSQVFWAIADSQMRYPQNFVPIYDAFLDRVPDHKPERMQIVEALLKRELLHADNARQFAQRFVEATVREDPKCYLGNIAAILERFGVDFRILQDHISHRIQLALDSGDGISDEILEWIPKLDLQEITSKPIPFDLDIQADEQYGKLTWRPEQTLIDFLQNHLDAQAYKYVIELLNAAFADVVSPSGLRALRTDHILLNQLWNFAHRWPFDPTTTGALDCIPYQYRNNPDDLAAKIDAVRPLTQPEIQIIVKNSDGTEQFIEYSMASPMQLKQCTGIQYRDTGIGYDKNLNALFAPTKHFLQFLRGQFGQGTKMGLIALVRSGCTVELASAVADNNTGEIRQWQGRPYHSNTSDSIRFKGLETRSMQPNNDFPLGTTTTIRFDSADTSTKTVFRNMLAKHVDADGIGAYVLDFNSISNQYVYGSLETNSQVCTNSTLRGKHWVQGLQVPSNSFPLYCAYSYNFADTNVLTGRDRTYMDAQVAKREILKLWRGMTDINTLTSFYYGLFQMYPIPSMGPPSNAFELTDLIYDLSYRLTPEAIESHQQVLAKIFSLQNATKIILASRKDIEQVSPDTMEKIKQLTDMRVLEAPSTDAASLITKVFGKERIVSLKKTVQAIEQRPDEQEENFSEELQKNCSRLSAEVSDLLQSVLRSNGISAEADMLGKEPLLIKLRKRSTSPSVPVVVSRALDYDDDNKVRSLGLSISVYPELLGIKITDNVFPAESQKILTTLLFVRLCSIIPSLNTQRSEISYLEAQDIPNQLLGKFAKSRPDLQQPLHNLQLTLNPNDLSALIQASSQDLLEKVAKHKKLFTLTEPITKLGTAGSISLSEFMPVIDAYNQPSTEVEVRSTILELLQTHYLLSRPVSFVGGRFLLEMSLDNSSITPTPLESTEIGKKRSHTVYQEGSGEHTSLRIPFDFSITDIALVSCGNTRVPISRFKNFSRIPAATSGLDDPAAFFSQTTTSPEWYLDTYAYASNDALVFPVGNQDADVITRRISYFMNELPLSINSEDNGDREELNEGVEYIETNASTDYGSGKVWDDPIRIFSEVSQNHKDAGNPSLQYQLATGETVSEKELLLPQYQDAQITGFIFQDSGTGYTTRGLTKWGDSTKSHSGKAGRYGEGQKMLVVSAARNNISVELSSRNWSARVTRIPKQILINGESTDIDVAGYKMQWQDKARTGSETRILISDNPSAGQQLTWNKWLNVLDPRVNQDENGNKGLARYVRDLRKDSEREIRIGKVTILPDESGQIYERGLIVLDVAKKLNIHLLFSVDISDNIIATQERNMIDKQQFVSELEAAYKHAPYELCVAVFRKLHKYVSAQRIGISNVSHFEEIIGTANYLEYSLIAKVADKSKLMSAFFEVFGTDVLLSSKEEAINCTSTVGIYDPKTGELRSEEEVAFYQGLIAFETTNFNPDALLNFGPELSQLRSALHLHVPSTQKLYESMLSKPMELSPEQNKIIQNFVQKVAGELLLTINRIYSSEAGKAVIDSIFETESPSNFFKTRLPIGLTKMEYATYFLSAVSSGELSIEITVNENMFGVFGYVNGARSLTFAGKTLNDPEQAIETTIHELLHLAFGLRDYNPGFVTLLLLANPELSNRLIAPKLSN